MSAEDGKGPFTAATVAWLIGVGLFCTLALVVLGAYAPELRSGDDGQGHALSRSGAGFAGTAQLLGDSGFEVRLSRGPLGPADEGGLLIVTPPASRVESFQILYPAETTLIVLPKWFTSPHPRRQGWVETRGLMPEVMTLSPLTDKLRSGLTLTRAADVPGEVPRQAVRIVGGETLTGLRGVRSLQALSDLGENWRPVITDESGRALLAMHRDSGVYVLAEPDLLNTAGMADLATARAVDTMIHTIWSGDGPVIFDVTAWGFAAPRSVLRLALEPPLLGATLCLLAAVALTGWQAAARFGAHRREARAIALGKRALADNTAGLIRLGRRERAMARPYAELIRARAAREVGAPRGLDPASTDALLARLPGSDIGYPAAVDRLEQARTPADLAEAAHELYRWKKEVAHGRR